MSRTGFSDSAATILASIDLVVILKFARIGAMSLLALTSPIDRLLFSPRSVELFISVWASLTIISVLLSLADND